jgi:hypothetical protein
MVRYAERISNHSLFEYVSPTVETRAAGLEAASFVRGEQSRALFAILVNVFPDGLSNNDLSRLSGFKINAVTARMKELRCVEIGASRDFLIESWTKKPDSLTGVLNVVWRVNPAYFTPSNEV